MPSSKLPRRLPRMSGWLGVLACLFFYSALTYGQSTGGRILGRVTDSSGASLGSVQVTATNEATNVSVTAVSNSNGEYGFPQVAVGVYSVEFDLTGFKNVVLRRRPGRYASRVHNRASMQEDAINLAPR